MNAFHLSENIDKSKVFLVNKSQIQKRLDPYYYKPDFQSIESLMSSIQVTKLMNASSKIFSGITPLSRGDAYTDKSNGTAFIRSGDFTNDNTIDFNQLNYIKPEAHHGLMKGSKLNREDILVAIVGATIGKIGVYNYDNEANINQAICAVRLNKELDPFYVQAFLLTHIGQKLIDRLKRPVARANINLEEIGSIPIPLIDLRLQKKVVALFRKGVEHKQAKEQQAKDLLAYVDKYMLKVLSINLPEPDNSLQNRMFKVPFSKVTGNRFDPKLYDNNSQKLFVAVENSSIPKIPLKSLITQSVSGEWGLDENASVQEDQYERCVVIRATEFDNDFNLNIENSRVKYRQIIKDKLELLDVQENDLLLEKSGGSPDQPVGRIAILQKELLEEYHPICFSNFVQKIRPDGTQVLPEYLFCFLKTIHNINITEVMQSQTSGIRNLIIREYFNQSIILPEKTKQIEIADKVNEMRNNAFQLLQEADKELAKASWEAAQVIFGEKNI